MCWGIDIARDDIDTSLHGIRPLSGFPIQHELAFQAADGGPGICNGDLALPGSETSAFWTPSSPRTGTYASAESGYGQG